MTEILDAIRLRRARRAIDPRAVPADIQALLWEAAALAPSQGNNQTARLLVASGDGQRSALFEALSQGNRNWAGTAPLLVAVAGLPAHEAAMSQGEAPAREMAGFHAGLATGNLLAEATALGLIAHPMAGYDEPAVRRVFGAPESLRVFTIVAIGYPGSPESLPEDLQQREHAPRLRLPLDYVVGVDRWDARMNVSMREWRDQQEQR